MALLSGEGLNVCYDSSDGPPIWSVRDVDIAVNEGEMVGLVGESGCGKSTLGYSLTRLLRPPGRHMSGRVIFDGTDVTDLGKQQLRSYRQHGMAVVLQSGMNALNPVRSVWGHFADVMRARGRIGRPLISKRAGELLDSVHLDADVLPRFPHELSGGMRQRVAIALALALEPKVVVFDEPTTALDVLVQQAVMETIAELQAKVGFAALVISHDLGLLLQSADRILVMYAGRIVEQGDAAGLVESAQHPYTKALLACFGDPSADRVEIVGIPGSPPDLSIESEECQFRPRCPRAEQVCFTRPPLASLGASMVACHLVAREWASSGKPT